MVGLVLKGFVKFTVPPKHKIFVIVGMNKEDNSVGVLLINSNINLARIPEQLADLHLYLRGEDHAFLKWDSYLDCSRIHSMQYGHIKASISQKPECVLGRISKETWGLVIQRIRQSPKISPKKLRQFGFTP